MALNFSGIFPPERGKLFNFTFTDFVQNAGYVTLYGGLQALNQTLYESYTDTDDTNESTSTTDWTAQTFTIGTTGSNIDFILSEIRFRAANLSNFIIELQETTTGEPNGTVVAKWVQGTSTIVTVDSGTNTYGLTLRNSLFTKNRGKLSSGTTYAIVFYQHTSTTSDVRFINVGSYTGGAKYDSANSGSTWTEDSGSDLWFEVYGTLTNPNIISTVQFSTTDSSTLISVFKVTASTFTSVGKMSFDSKFQNSVLVKGDAFLEATVASGVDKFYSVAKLYHVDKSDNETEMASLQFETGVAGLKGVLPISQTKFSPDEILRLEFEFFYIDDNNPAMGFGDGITINHDPNGTQILLNLPFKVP